MRDLVRRPRSGDSPATVDVNDDERILDDIDRLDIDAEELELTRGVIPPVVPRRRSRSRTPSTTPTSGGTSTTRVSGAQQGLN